MQKFFHFVVCDFSFLDNFCQNPIKFLSFPKLQFLPRLRKERKLKAFLVLLRRKNNRHRRNDNTCGVFTASRFRRSRLRNWRLRARNRFGLRRSCFGGLRLACRRFGYFRLILSRFRHAFSDLNGFAVRSSDFVGFKIFWFGYVIFSIFVRFFDRILIF